MVPFKASVADCISNHFSSLEKIREEMVPFKTNSESHGLPNAVDIIYLQQIIFTHVGIMGLGGD
jgi:hypothetical protein